jgi:multimeric flavodoxin WrbA
MTKLLIVYHSRTGNTEVMAKAVYEGAISSGATVSLKKVADATMNDLLDCESVIFGTCNNFNYMAGIMKEYFDQAWLTFGDTTANKSYSAFSSAGSGRRTALDSIDSVCNSFNERKEFKLRKAFDGVAATRELSPEVLQLCRELGNKMAQQ